MTRIEALNDFKKQLRLIGFDYSNVAFGVSAAAKPQYNVDDNSTVNDNTHYIICLYTTKKLFIVWDYNRHKAEGKLTSTFSVSKKWEDLINEKHPITFPYYKRMGNKKDSPCEKVYVVDFRDYKDFFLNIDQYMEFNEYDIDENGKPIAKTIDREPKSPLKSNERKRYSSSRLQRDYNFRTAVLKAYNNQCAICRTKNEAVLQAAHLHGFEVAKTDLNADNPKNGICLCANHHLMYDDYYFEVDVSNLQIVVKKFSIENESWYTHFIDKNGYDGKILKRNDQEN